MYLHTGSLTLCRSDVVTGSPLPASFTAITLNSISDPSFRPPTVNVVSLDGWLLTGAQSPRLPLFSTTYPVNNIIIHFYYVYDVYPEKYMSLGVKPYYSKCNSKHFFIDFWRVLKPAVLSLSTRKNTLLFGIVYHRV